LVPAVVVSPEHLEPVGRGVRPDEIAEALQPVAAAGVTERALHRVQPAVFLEHHAAPGPEAITSQMAWQLSIYNDKASAGE